MLHGWLDQIGGYLKCYQDIKAIKAKKLKIETGYGLFQCKMSPIYYFVNYTCKEFCCFNNNYPIFKELTHIVKWNRRWTLEDDIRVESELAGSTFLIQHLVNDLQFTNLDYDSSEDSVPDSVA